MADTRPISIALTMCPPWGLPSIPIGIAYLDEYLRAHGVETRVVDLNLDLYLEQGEDARALWRTGSVHRWLGEGGFDATAEPFAAMVNSAVRKLATTNAEAIGFSVNEANLLFTAAVVEKLRPSTEAALIVGGPGVFDPPARTVFADRVDHFIAGEGELALLRLLIALRDGATPEADGSDRADLAQIPWPRFTGFDVERYLAFDNLPVLFSRGCFCHCHFCGDHPLWRGYRFRPPERIVDEIRHHVETFGVTAIRVNDLAMNGQPQKLEAVCDRLIESELELEWGGNLAVRDMPQRLFGKLARAGCRTVNIGLESGSGTVLARMNKPHTPGAAETFFARCEAAGIRVNAALIVGFPGETDSEFEETKRFLWNNRTRIAAVSPLSVSFLKPLSPIERDPERFGIAPLPAHAWISYLDENGLDYPGRLARMRDLQAFLASAGIAIDDENVFGVFDGDAQYLRRRTVRRDGVTAFFHDGALHVFRGHRPAFGTQGLHLVFIDEGWSASHTGYAWQVERTSEFGLLGRGKPVAGDTSRQVRWNVELLPTEAVRIRVDVKASGKVGMTIAQIPLGGFGRVTRDAFGSTALCEAARDNGRAVWVDGVGTPYQVDATAASGSLDPFTDRYSLQVDDDGGARYLAYEKNLLAVGSSGDVRRVLDLDFQLAPSATKSLPSSATIASKNTALRFLDGFWYLIDTADAGGLLTAPAMQLSVAFGDQGGLRGERFRWIAEPGTDASFVGRPWDGTPIEVAQQAVVERDAYRFRIGIRSTSTAENAHAMLRVDLPLASRFANVIGENSEFAWSARDGIDNVPGPVLEAVSADGERVAVSVKPDTAIEPQAQSADQHAERVRAILAMSGHDTPALTIHTGKYPVPLTRAFRWLEFVLRPSVR